MSASALPCAARRAGHAASGGGATRSLLRRRTSTSAPRPPCHANPPCLGRSHHGGELRCGRRSVTLGAQGAAPAGVGAAPASTATELGEATASFDATVSLEGTYSMDSDGEFCQLLPDPITGDVQMVCDSDPVHPVSLAENAVLHPIVPTTLLQDIETKLESDLTTILVTVIFAVGFICLEFGVTDLIEIVWGETVLSDIVCVLVGLAVVFGIRLTDLRPMRLWR